MKCLTWNLEWKLPVSDAGRLIQEEITRHDPDVICFTEVVRNMVPAGYSIEADSDYGYKHNGGRRKVILWSKNPWTEIDIIGDDEMPRGRFVSGLTGGIRFVGICIPWSAAHVKDGRKDRKTWQDHVSYCRGLGRIFGRYDSDKVPTCILGDFNQRIPRVHQPIDVAKALTSAIPPEFTILTEGMQDSDVKNIIDHIVVSRELAGSMTQIIPRYASDGTELSDHVGVFTCLKNRKSEPCY